MENNTTRSFYYKASRDIISTFIGAFFTLVGFFIMKALLSPLLTFMFYMISEDEIKMGITICAWIYALIAIPTLIVCFLDIYCHTFRCLTIGQDEITYSYGWLTKGTTSIPSHKIRSCSKASGVLQRACGTMTIAITTTGDGAEIYFSNIVNGEEAYQLISQLAKVDEL